MAKPPVGAPWAPAKWTDAEAGAIQAMARGDADGPAQQRALKWIVETLCGTYDLSFRADSERVSAFAEGKRFVGLQIVKMTKLNLAALRKMKNE